MVGGRYLFGFKVRIVALCTWMLMIFVAAHADTRQTPSATNAEPPIREQSNPDSTTPNQNENEPQHSHRGAFVAVPVPISSPALGTGATVLAGYIFPLVAKDKVSPPSIIGGAGLFTNNGTRAFVIGTELYFKENRYHILAGVAHGDLNYDFYGIGNEAGNAGLKLGLKQTGTIAFGEVLRRVGWKIFVGPRVWIGSSMLASQRVRDNHPDLPPLEVGFKMRSLGFKVERDTTPNRFYPEEGTSLLFNADFFSKGLGSTFGFQRYRLTFNGYHSFDARQSLAYNIHLCSTGGEAPFFGQCIFGTRNELRGYTGGRYIDRKMIATQVEYRLVLPKRFGVVAFAGVGEVAPTVAKFNYDNLLGSVGGGVRFNLSSKYHVNLRADIAQGKNGHTLSLGLGEAF